MILIERIYPTIRKLIVTSLCIVATQKALCMVEVILTGRASRIRPKRLII